MPWNFQSVSVRLLERIVIQFKCGAISVLQLAEGMDDHHNVNLRKAEDNRKQPSRFIFFAANYLFEGPLIRNLNLEELETHLRVLLLFYQEGLVLHTSMGNCMTRNLKDQDDSDNAVDFAGGNVHLITTKESWDEKISEANKDGKFVVANFSAAWCGPCKIIAPLYCELSEKYPTLMFLTVDVDELIEFSSSWDIRATPTFFVLKDGQQVDKLVGANKPELQRKITNIANSIAQNS